MLRRLLRSRDYGGLIVFLVVLVILFYVSNELLGMIPTIRLPVIGARANQRTTELIETLAAATLTPTPSPVVAPAGQPTPTSTAPPTPAPTPLPVRKVGNTGGLGVYLRRTPNVNDRLRAWVDNSEMTLLGEETDAGNFHWVKVRDPAGNEGWIPAQYLVAP